MHEKLSDKEFSTIAKKIREDIFEPAYQFKTTIFLCGADKNLKSTLRHKIATAFSENFWRSWFYHLVYPEDIFDELLYSPTNDLLTLENLLADSVDVIIIIPESPGSFAELGAFANNEKLRSKIVCVIDEKYKKNRSFITQGPVKLVKNANPQSIVYVDPNLLGQTADYDLFKMFVHDPEAEKIATAIRKLKKSSKRSDAPISLLQLDKFLLPTIFLLEPVYKSTLIQIVSSAMSSTKFSTTSTMTALTMLTKKRFIQLTSEGYKLTKLGRNEFLSFRKTNSRFKNQDKTVAIDDLRLEILNLQLRKKKLKV